MKQPTFLRIRREGRDRGRGQVDGIVWRDVEWICAHAEAEHTVVGLRDSALIQLMSDCLLRISEVVAVNVNNFQENTLRIASSKTNQSLKGETLYVGDSTMQAIERYKAKAAVHQGALFRVVRYSNSVDTCRLGTNAARLAIKRRAQAAGVEGFISGHSLRVGSAVSLAQAGASIVDMQVAGRWKSSEMPAHYAKAELIERGAIARFKYKK